MTDTGWVLLLVGWWLLGLPLTFSNESIVSWHPVHRKLRALLNTGHIKKPKGTEYLQLLKLYMTSQNFSEAEYQRAARDFRLGKIRYILLLLLWTGALLAVAYKAFPILFTE